jgi:hypothetical protein
MNVDHCHRTIDDSSSPCTTIIANSSNGLCNILKNVLSVFRIKYKKNYNFLLTKNEHLVDLFDIPQMYFSQDNSPNNVIYRDSWRLAIFESDKNLDKIIDNTFSCIFPDFTDHLFFSSYKNNCIDFIYRPDLFHEIYEDYSNLFKELIIKENILEEINNFSKQFTENTISVHLRSWVDAPWRRDAFDINNFYKEIEKYNNGIHNFFIASDDINLSSQIKQKYGDKIILYERPCEKPVIKDFIDLILLSKNNILIGTYISTFTEMAYLINYNIKKKIIIL